MLTIFYARVSTRHQSCDHQIHQARQAFPGLTFDHVLVDDGVSGITTRLAERPSGKRLFDLLRHGDVLVVRWIDRLGRDYDDVTDTMQELLARGVTVKTAINGMIFDGTSTDPLSCALRDTLLSCIAASVHAQVEAMKESQRSGIEKAQQAGHFRGRRPTFTSGDVDFIVKNRDTMSKKAMSRHCGIARGTVYNVLADPDEAYRMLERWALAA